MKSTEDFMKLHTLIFPYAIVVFGRTYNMPCTVNFSYHEDPDGDIKLSIKQLTAQDHTGSVYDMMSLVEEPESEIASDILEAIVYNQAKWDWEPEGDELVWW